MTDVDDDQQGNQTGAADDPQGSGSGPDGLGSLTEEALKLAGAFTQWAATQGTDLGRHVHGVTEQAREAWDDLEDHLATGSPECTVCPVCRAVAAAREVAPEVKEHLGAAAGSLLGAAAGLLQIWGAARSHSPADQTASPPHAQDASGSRVQDIALDDDPDSAT